MLFKHKISLLVVFVIYSLTGNPGMSSTQADRFYIAIEFNKVLCGYSEVTVSDSIINGKNHKVLSQEVHFDFSALGRDMSQYQKFTYHIDPATGNFIYHDSFHRQEGVERGGQAFVEDGKVRFVSGDNQDDEVFDLIEGAILPNTQFYYHLKKDFGDKAVEQKAYQVFDVRTGKISEVSYVKTGEEQMELANNTYDAVMLIESDAKSGMDTKIWIDKFTGMRLRMESPTRMIMFLADESVKSQITKGNWDDVILARTNKYISKIQGISYLKVKVILEATPKPVLEDLQISGQKFTGEIKGHKIDGIFEISHTKYNGENCPEFPMPVDKIKNLESWLEPTAYIESDDPVLIKAAKEITDGSKDLWDAAHRISQWVIKNIDGSLQAGTARETYDNRTGLCGSQSMLMAALCRAVGIPSRVAWGVMYTHELGGSFGHHGWNEVYMGDAGWIPLDVTSHESNYVDSGHIRIGVLNTTQTYLDYHTMEILDFKTR